MKASQLLISIAAIASASSFGATALTSSSSTADVLLFQSDSSASSSTTVRSHVSRDPIPRNVARYLLEQRLGTQQHVFLQEATESAIDPEALLAYVSTYGKPPRPIFSAERAEHEPAQLVLFIEGLSQKERASVLKQVETFATGTNLNEGQRGSISTFSIIDAPHAVANEQIMSDLRQVTNGCTLEETIDPLNKDCWRGPSSISRFDASKDSSLVKRLAMSLPKLRSLSQDGVVETALVLFPDSASAASWSSSTEGYRRHFTQSLEAEFISNAVQEELGQDHGVFDSGNDAIFAEEKINQMGKKKVKFPACFETLDACATSTGNCTGHGECINRFGSSSSKACFVCSCFRSQEADSKSDATTQWAGAACQKIDVSTPFALFVGFAIAFISILVLSIRLLFQVGEEPLPGVIGAGVSKSKST